jgi:hypothetical protein
MSARSIWLLIVVLAIASALALAESTDCTSPVLIISDGRITQSTFSQNSTYWYGVYAQSGHSYSIEFEPPADNYATTLKVQFNPATVFGPADSLLACRGISSVSVTQNSGYAPVILKNGNGMGRRLSFIAQSAGLYLISIMNLGTSGTYSFRAVDTTLVNPRWSTCSGYFTHWGILNVSDMPISGTLTIFDIGGRPLASAQMSLGPGTEQFRVTLPSDLNLAPNIAGYATFVHNGPPDAIVADSYMVGNNGTVIYVSKFERLGAH